MVVSPPAEGLEFVCEDHLPVLDLELRALDAATGEPIEEISSRVWIGEPGPDSQLRPDRKHDTNLYQDVSRGAPLQWILGAKGYRLAQGTEADALLEGNRQVIVARLEPGWGHIYTLTRPGRPVGEPIEGVELIADGVSIGFQRRARQDLL
jgi:hypothetical protein